MGLFHGICLLPSATVRTISATSAIDACAIPQLETWVRIFVCEKTGAEGPCSWTMTSAGRISAKASTRLPCNAEIDELAE